MPERHDSRPEIRRVDGVSGAESWVFGNSNVDIAMTVDGGQLAPVRFFADTATAIQPYYVSPWATEGYRGPTGQEIVDIMRGDVFCFPFGVPSEDDAGEYAQHGEITSAPWRWDSSERLGETTAHSFSVGLGNPSGTVVKKIALVDGHNVLYQRHEISGVSGDFPLGHHPMLTSPASEGGVLIGAGPGRSGRTWPTSFEDTAGGGYSSLAIDEAFSDLGSVPSLWSPSAPQAMDQFPLRRGFTDAVMLIQDGIDRLGWTTATYVEEGFLWFSLRDARALPMTIVVMMNRGRHYEPWNGREVILGLQDVRSYFAGGAVGSRLPNPLSAAGSETVFSFAPEETLVVNHIQGVAKVPPGYGRVVSVELLARGVTFVDEVGKRVDVDVVHEFLSGGLAALNSA